jgi:hypothetical protein
MFRSRTKSQSNLATQARTARHSGTSNADSCAWPEEPDPHSTVNAVAVQPSGA